MNSAQFLNCIDKPVDYRTRCGHLLAILISSQTQAEKLELTDIATLIEQAAIDMNYVILDSFSMPSLDI